MDRRQFLFTTAGITAVGCATLPAAPAGEPAIARLEREQGGRLGVIAIDLGSERRLEHRADERFPMCSTFKTLLAAAVVKRAESDGFGLGRSLSYDQSDLLEHSPVTEKNLGQGRMTVGELCQAAVGASDNTAANLLLKDLGGPAALNDFVRQLGDPVTRLDRLEPMLNEAIPGDPRDTTTPRAMAEDLRRLFFGDVLGQRLRTPFIGWHRWSTVGAGRLRAGLPADWPIAHKPGTGQHGSTNDVAVVWRPNRAPLIVAAYYTERAALLPSLEAVLAGVGAIVGREFEA